MIRSSPELLAVTRRWYEAMRTLDKTIIQNFMTSSAHLRYVGTADNEIWSGPAVREALGAHYKEMPRIRERQEVLAEAFEMGDVGWAFFINKMRFEGREEPVTFRTTFVFALEDGTWKIVQRHTSCGIPNQAILGYEHGAIQDLLDTARQDLSLIQREGLASVMFTDIVNSASLAAALGDRAWSRLISDHFATLRETVESHGGQFVKTSGDGTLSSFSSARAALSAARSIQRTLAQQTSEPRLSLRIGLHTGDLIQSDADFFGTVVNKSARITALTGPGEICVSDVTRAIVGDEPGFVFSEAVPVPLKGLEGTHLIHRLEWRD